MSAPHQQTLPFANARARRRPQRGPLASRRSTAALVAATERFDSAQAVLHAIKTRRHSLRFCSRLSGAPRAPVVVPAGPMPGPPGSGVTSPARRNRTRSINRLSPVDDPEVSEIRRNCSRPGDRCQWKCDAEETRYAQLAGRKSSSTARPRESGDPALRQSPWIPAFAGMSGDEETRCAQLAGHDLTMVRSKE